MSTTTNKYFNATELIPRDHKGRCTKRVCHFLDNKRIKVPKDLPKPGRGRGSFTLLPVELLPEFLLWLTPKTRNAILNNEDPQKIIKHIKDYW